MRLRTFLATYVLFLVIFFGGLGIVSAYMTGSQLDMLKEKSVAEYQTIAASFAKDIAVLSGRQQEPEEFVKSVHALAEAYAGYYRKNGITLRLEEVPPPEAEATPQSELSYARQGQEHFLFISENLSVPLQQYFRLEYAYNITGNIADLDAIRRVLLALALGCSVLTAFALYAILTKVFSPFSVVARVSRKIAGGMYSERIHVKGSHELASMARDFNRMAAKIERQIHLLEEETAQKQQFVDNFAHEIRTPLTSIYGYAEYVQNAPLDKAEVIESAQAILKEAGYMRKIADSLLELATLRQYAANKRAIDLPRLLPTSAKACAAWPPHRRSETSRSCARAALRFCTARRICSAACS